MSNEQRLSAGQDLAIASYIVLAMYNDSEWAYILQGHEDVGKSDLRSFPQGVPHSLQGLEVSCEFLLIFNGDGKSSEYKAFQLTDWLAHTPRDILRKNFKVPKSTLEHLPAREQFIFRSIFSKKSTADGTQSGPTPTRRRLTHKMLAQEPTKVPGGEVRVVDSTNFPVTTISAAHVVINTGALREKNSLTPVCGRVVDVPEREDEVNGNFVAGDVIIVPRDCRHYIESIGYPIEMLEIFKSPKFEEFSLKQWLAITPLHLVQAHLNVGEEFTKALGKGHTPMRDGHVLQNAGHAVKNASGKPSAKL
ncbi:RmlC-like cupin domain-containing protein [Fomitopsis serialis]|uniref:RmlC-like cupin domain-containing protein n=1 Tax=Fomitopsis serialis TaxID=139415 RepID=UPI0020077ED4|nr:RmlC-like cupin domain-containing protein [Neoantrodia serialis]KAH9924049.1 RmlC-like cupin domain-containing protein [Neoantrodia serialis]